jgi:3-oxoadipate enol-lactonase
VTSVEVGGRELHYLRSGSGPPLLLIQGMSGTHLAWGRPFLEALEASFDCVVYDNRGMGLSGRAEEPFTIAELASDALGLLDGLGFEGVHVLGISMGGMIAQELALAAPDRLLSMSLGATYCGGAGSRLMDPADFQRLAAAAASGDRDRAVRASWEVNLSPGFRGDETRYAEFKQMADALPAPLPVIVRQLQAISSHDTSRRLASIEVPTLVIHGTEDRVLNASNGRQIAALMQAPLELLEGVGHMFWWEQPERSAALVRGHALAAARP